MARHGLRISPKCANLEIGVVDKSWARRLVLRGFVTQYDKEIQHNLFMTFNPYGDVTLSELSAGGTARYESTFGERFSVEAVLGYSFGIMKYRDVGECVYDWFGQCVRERAQPGERNGRAEDQRYGEHNAYGRVNLDHRLHPEHFKASYEWATRLPRPDEIFGNAFPIQANRELKPEISHNINLSITVDARVASGRWR